MDDQATIWNGPNGQAWVAGQAIMDQTLRAFEDLLVAHVAASGASQVLDVGCGTGATTLSAARALGPDAAVTGVDVSAPMLARARERATAEGSQATFVLGDAQRQAFAAGAYDLLVSRFGVMFFDDPVAAFANLRAAARPRAGLWFVAWRAPAENPFSTMAERAAARFLPDLPTRKADVPGQFGFADGTRMREILTSAGWEDVVVVPIDVPCAFDLDDLEPYITVLGSLSRVLGELEPERRAEVLDAVRATYEPYIHGPEVRFTAACWQVTARAPGG